MTIYINGKRVGGGGEDEGGGNQVAVGNIVGGDLIQSRGDRTDDSDGVDSSDRGGNG